MWVVLANLGCQLFRSGINTNSNGYSYEEFFITMLNVADTLEAAQMEGNFTLGLIALTLTGKFIYPVAVAFLQQY